MNGVYLRLQTATVTVGEGPLVLAGISEGPGLAAHRQRYPVPGDWTLPDALASLEASGLRGRGGAGFPFARKLATAARRRGTVVVNASEGEPASFKDAALTILRPHLVLDGAEVAARLIGAREVHVVASGHHLGVGESLATAIEERRSVRRTGGRVNWRLHQAGAHFVAGQASSVLQLIAGRENAPVTTWQPEAISGLRGRPTLLSNAETFAHVGLVLGAGAASYRRTGTDAEPGTMLLSLRGDTVRPEVGEVPFGTPWQAVLSAEELAGPVLLGGFHGSWLAGGALDGHRVSREDAALLGVSLGAGIVLPIGPSRCPIDETVRVVRFLAGESAGRCGPCRNGLPALAHAVEALASGRDYRSRLEELLGVLPGRGACAHPDGTARLVASLLRAFPQEVDAHAHGVCLGATWAGVYR